MTQAINESKHWYICKQATGECLIVNRDRTQEELESWGPFASQGEAVARRVGLIRAGKCQPV